MFDTYTDFFTNPQSILVFKAIGYTAPVWGTFFFGIMFWNMWITYVRIKYLASLTYVLLEVKLPKEIFKSPKAMEFLFNALYQTGGEGTWVDVYWKGQTRADYTLELCAIDGKLHFFIRTRKAFKNLIEANLYSQYPGIEIFEVPDYTLPISFDPEKSSMWGAEFELTKSDPFPIKTYIDYGMDKDPKEEFKIDPMTPLVEFLASSMGAGHNAWIQIHIRAHKAEDFNKETGKLEDARWAKGAEKEIEKIRDKTKPKDEKSQARRLTKGEEEIISALERNITKPGFDVGIRAVYIAPKDIFNSAVGAGIVAGFRNYNSADLNGFKATRVPDGLANYPWQDRSKKKRNKAKTEMLDAYKHRGYFYNEFATPHFILNTEELATIFHLPGGVATTPAFERIGSKKAEAPSNLPQ
jgi:hypothetical protein